MAIDVIGAWLSNRPKKVTEQPTFDAAFDPLKTDLLASTRKRMADPMTAAAPYKHAINRRFQSLPGRVSTNLAKRGMLKSGQLGANLKGVEFARQDALSNLEGTLDQNTMDLALRLLGTGRGNATTYPGIGLPGAIGQGLENFTAMAMLSELLAGGG
jgi:hypothetical protein